MPNFMVELAGSFYTFTLYGAKGEPITDMMKAAEFAENEFGTDWNSVFNGVEAIERDDYIG